MPERRWKRCGSEAFAWIAGPSPAEGLLREAESKSASARRRVKPGNDEGKNGRTNERKCRRRNADRRKALLPWQRPRPRLSAERRTSIGVPPRFSPQGVFHRKGLSLRPGFLGRGGR